MEFQIGCDVGGTFTDIFVVDAEGNGYRNKADSNPGDFSIGVMDVIRLVAADIGISEEELIKNTTRFINGTTVVTNTIIQLNGAKTGLLVTKGTGDTLRIARSARTADRDHLYHQLNVPDIVPRDCIKEITERVDYAGDIIVPLNEGEVREALRELVEERKVEAVAVCFLWSFLNDEHEKRVKEIITEQYPDLYLSLSCEIHPQIREYERMTTTVLNSYVGVSAVQYVNKLKERLTELGFNGELVFVQAIGGSTLPEEAKKAPINLLDSGPSAGVSACTSFGKSLGYNNILYCDMGGTSFDCSIIEAGKYRVVDRCMVQNLLTGLNKIDFTTAGAGGGSIVWIDTRGVPQVGPESAGAVPGPVSYAFGGENPTLTDAAVVLGLISPEKFLGGRRKLDKGKAKQVFLEKIGKPLNVNAESAAVAAYRIATETMRDAVRTVSIERGRDPRDFALMAIGGASALFAAPIALSLGINTVIVPGDASVFSAFSLLQIDDIRYFKKSISWEPGYLLDEVNETLDELEKTGRDLLIESGYEESQIKVERSGDFKFKGQLFDWPIVFPKGELTDGDMKKIEEDFPEDYEREFGLGTAWVEARVVLTGVSVVCTATPKKIVLSPVHKAVEGIKIKPIDTRRIYSLTKSGKQEDVDIYRGDDLKPGMDLIGPAIIEKNFTTIYAPSECSVKVDEYLNCIINKREM